MVQIHLKETRNSYFCVTSKNHRLMFVSSKNLKTAIPTIIIQEPSCSLTKFVCKAKSANSSMR